MTRLVIYGVLLTLAFLFVLFQKKEGAEMGALARGTDLAMSPPPASSDVAMPVQSQEYDEETFVVTKVVDGDTLRVLRGGAEDTVRLIGVNTPESVDPRRPVECFGREASAHTSSLALGKTVRLEGDSTQDVRDKYGRLLAYVYLPDGSLLNELLVRDGYAYEYTYKVPYQYQAKFKEAERVARKEGRGLFASGACGEQNITSVDGGTRNAKAYLSAERGTWECARNTYNCSNFSSQHEAQEVFVFCGGPSLDVHYLDIDHDGRVCETLP